MYDINTSEREALWLTNAPAAPPSRPKTKEYVTLMARVPQDVADQAKRYAGLHRHTMSDVLRDGLLMLLQEQDPYRSYVSDMNAAQEIVSDVQSLSEREVQEIVSDANGVAENVSDIKEAMPALVPENMGVFAYPPEGVYFSETPHGLRRSLPHNLLMFRSL